MRIRCVVADSISVRTADRYLPLFKDDEAREEVGAFFERVGEYAKENGVSVNVVTM